MPLEPIEEIDPLPDAELPQPPVPSVQRSLRRSPPVPEATLGDDIDTEVMGLTGWRAQRGALLAVAGVLCLLALGLALFGGKRPPVAAPEPEAPPPPVAKAEVKREAGKGSGKFTTLLTPEAAPGAPALPERKVIAPRSRIVSPSSSDVAFARSLAEDRRGAVQLCFERELKRDPRVGGRVSVQLELEPPRTVAGVVVRSSISGSAFSTCVESAMRKMYLPPLTEALSIEIPFQLTKPQL